VHAATTIKKAKFLIHAFACPIIACLCMSITSNLFNIFKGFS
jgi:hypothetical protein